MAKHKKGKIINIKPNSFSPENYIRTQARSLPIAECVINTDWKTAGICNIIVTRMHKTGNVTFGLYLVDTFCLGMKNASYEFNMDPDEYAYYKSKLPEYEQCDYVLAHNIIYGGIAYAEDFGFKPHKDFALAQYILEEDDENVELMEIDFGLDGKPCYIRGPYDDEAKIKQIVSTLSRTAGEGSFSYVDNPEDFYDEDDDEFEDMTDEELEDYLVEEKEKAFKQYIKAFKKINTAYDKTARSPEARKAISRSSIGKNYKISKNALNYGFFDNAEQEDAYNQLSDMCLYEQNYEGAIRGALKAIKKYPGKPVFYNLLQFAYTFDEQYDKAEKYIKELYKLYPDYLFGKIYYANMLINNEQYEDVLAIFNHKGDLNEIYPGRNVFDTNETASYYACMCRYFIAVDDIDSADLYMNAGIKNKLIEYYGQTIFRLPIDELCNAKIDKLTGMGDTDL